MAWIVLLIAGLFETAWALLLKQSEGLTRPGHTAGFVVCLILSMVLLGQALRTLPVSSAYAVWTGIGAVGAAVIGMAWLGEPRGALKLLSLGLLLAGILGLRLTGDH